MTNQNDKLNYLKFINKNKLKQNENLIKKEAMHKTDKQFLMKIQPLP
jgi:hypothetical protein